MYFLDLVDDAHALARCIETGEFSEAIFRAARIVSVANEQSHTALADAALNVVAALQPSQRADRIALATDLVALAERITEVVEARHHGPSSVAFDITQARRRINLCAAMRELDREGVAHVQAKARALHTGRRFLEEMLEGRFIPSVFAREVEWVMHKPDGWMDEDPSSREI